MASKAKPNQLKDYQKLNHTNLLKAAKTNLLMVIDQVESLGSERDYSDLKAYLATCVEMFDEQLVEM